MTPVTQNKPPRPYRRYEGVAIYRCTQVIPGTDFRFDAQGAIKPCKPQYETWYTFVDGYPYSSVDECKHGIDAIHAACRKMDIPDAMFVQVMNTSKQED